MTKGVRVLGVAGPCRVLASTTMDARRGDCTAAATLALRRAASAGEAMAMTSEADAATPTSASVR